MSNHSSFLLESHRPRSAPLCRVSYNSLQARDCRTEIHTNDVNSTFVTTCGGVSVGKSSNRTHLPPQSPDLSTPASPVLIPYGGRMFEVRHLSGVRVILRKGVRPNCWHLASPQTATAVASAYDAGLSAPVFRS